MYNMEVESELFRGKALVAQHRMVNQVRVSFMLRRHQYISFYESQGKTHVKDDICIKQRGWRPYVDCFPDDSHL